MKRFPVRMFKCIYICLYAFMLFLPYIILIGFVFDLAKRGFGNYLAVV